MEVYVIYDHPGDYPDHFVVRRWRAVSGSVDPVPDPEPFVLVGTLAEARGAIPQGFMRFERNPGDDAVVVETWL